MWQSWCHRKLLGDSIYPSISYPHDPALLLEDVQFPSKFRVSSMGAVFSGLPDIFLFKFFFECQILFVNREKFISPITEARFLASPTLA